MFRTIGDPVSLWESRLPAEVLRLPEGLARVDALLDDPAFFAPFAPHFHPVIGRPSTPVECYLRLMFLKFRYRLGFERLCAEVADSISWRRFCRIPLDGKVPHPTTLMKLTTRCGEAAVAREETTQVIGRVTGALADLAASTAAEAAAVLRNGRRALPKAISGRMRGRLRRAAFTGVLAACRVPLPPTAATARPPSSTTCRHWACAPSRFPARPRSHPAARPPSTARASANSSSGAPDPRAGSAISSTPTGGTAPTWTVKKCRYLVRTRGLHPQPGQDRRPGQLTAPRGQPLHHLCPAQPAPASRQGLFQVEVAS